MLSRRRDWLSITPEPERELPRAIATLKSGGEPSPESVAAERRRAEQLVLRGSRRRWHGWLEQAERLARGVDPRAGGERIAEARATVLAVVHNHNALELGLPGRFPTWGGARKEVTSR